MAAELVSWTPAGEIEYFGTNDPEWNLAEHDDSVVYHGKVEPYAEKTWDDAVNVQNKTKVLRGLTYPIDFGIEDQLLQRESDMEGRSLKGICDAFENCAEKVTTNVAGFTMNKVIPLAVNAYAALDNGNTAIWDYIHKHPKAVKFVARVGKNKIVNGVASAYVFTLLTGIWQHKEVAECLTQGTEAATIVRMVTHTVTSISTITSTETTLQTVNGRNRYGAFQVTYEACTTCYTGKCSAATTKRRRFPRLEASKLYK